MMQENTVRLAPRGALMWLLRPPRQELPPPGDAPLPAEGPPHPPPFSQAEFLDSLQVP